MSVNSETDFTLPLIPEASQRYHGASPAAAYVPIAVALIGVAFILLGGIKARETGEATVVAHAPAAAGTLVVGSIGGNAAGTILTR